MDDEILDNIKFNLPHWSSVDADPSDIYTWLLDHEMYPEGSPEPTYYSDNEIKLATFALKFVDPDDEDDCVEDMQWLIDNDRVLGAEVSALAYYSQIPEYLKNNNPKYRSDNA
jgi:hypothetical protein